MIEYRWTKTGLNVEITSTVNGMLEQGGVLGRVEHYRAEDVARLGYTRDDDLDECEDNMVVTRLDMIRHHLQPRILRRGTLIQ